MSNKYTAYGFHKCKFNKCDEIMCYHCHKWTSQIYFGGTDYSDYREGEYLCVRCLDERIEADRALRTSEERGNETVVINVNGGTKRVWLDAYCKIQHRAMRTWWPTVTMDAIKEQVLLLKSGKEWTTVVGCWMKDEVVPDKEQRGGK